MAETIYTPTFKHVDWIDNEDVVEAGGENGFNARFHALETEFARLSKVISNINAAIVPVSPKITLSFLPGFFQNGRFPEVPNWGQAENGAQSGGKADVAGYMPLPLPDNVRMESITVTGKRRGQIGTFFIELMRQHITTLNEPSETLVSADLLSVKVDNIGKFTDTRPFFSVVDNNVVDNSTFTYSIAARAFNISGADSGAELIAIQIQCSRS